MSPENDQEELFERILSGEYEFTSPYWDPVSDTAKQLISNMLQAQPELRFSAEDVLDHPWLVVTIITFIFFSSIAIDITYYRRERKRKPHYMHGLHLGRIVSLDLIKNFKGISSGSLFGRAKFRLCFAMRVSK